MRRPKAAAGSRRLAWTRPSSLVEVGAVRHHEPYRPGGGHDLTARPAGSSRQRYQLPERQPPSSPPPVSQLRMYAMPSLRDREVGAGLGGLRDASSRADGRGVRRRRRRRPATRRRGRRRRAGSAKQDSICETALRASALALESCALALWPRNVGSAIAARIPMMRITTSSSIRVNPRSSIPEVIDGPAADLKCETSASYRSSRTTEGGPEGPPSIRLCDLIRCDYQLPAVGQPPLPRVVARAGVRGAALRDRELGAASDVA